MSKRSIHRHVARTMRRYLREQARSAREIMVVPTNDARIALHEPQPVIDLFFPIRPTRGWW